MNIIYAIAIHTHKHMIPIHTILFDAMVRVTRYGQFIKTDPVSQKTFYLVKSQKGEPMARDRYFIIHGHIAPFYTTASSVRHNCV